MTMNPEQAALMEKLKRMSPEELRDFQKKQCIFCQINSDKSKAKLVYEDRYCFAIMDINPAQTGHVLLLSKEHYTIMPQVPEDVLAHLAVVTKKISQAILKGLKVQGTNVFVANGTAAGQRAQHFMIHVIPRRNNDSVTLELPQKKGDEKSIAKIREVIQNKANTMFGIKKEVVIAEQIKSNDGEKEGHYEQKRSKSKKKKKKQKTDDVTLDDIAGLF
jgi:histidine triad (HIT) family protein